MLRTLTLHTLLLLPAALAAHHHSKQTLRLSENDVEDNYLSDLVDSSAPPSAAAYTATYSNHRDLHIPPSPFVKSAEQRHPGPPHLHLSRTSSHPPNRHLHDLVDQRPPPDNPIDFTGVSNGNGGVSYILTAGGKERIYGGEEEQKPPPHALPLFHPKKFAFDKSFKKYRFAYSGAGGISPIVVNAISGGGSSSTTVPENHREAKEPLTKDTAGATSSSASDGSAAAASRAFNPLHPPSSAPVVHHKFFSDNTDMYMGKGTVWKQLGPNVEISSAAEHVPFTRHGASGAAASPKERKKSKASSQQQRKGGHKNLRTGYMSQQHALYVANNLASGLNLKSPKGGTGGIGAIALAGGGAAFDHSQMLRQSDKFELTDAMISEAEKEEAYKNAAGKNLRVRFKQEAAPLPPILAAAAGYQPEQYEPQSMAAPLSPYYVHSNTPPFSLVPAASNPPFMPHHLATYGKGFVRHIEIEMNGAGGPRKVMPALIIPLTVDPTTGSGYMGGGTGSGEGLSAAYLGHTHVDRQPKATFPYEIVAPAPLPPRYLPVGEPVNGAASSVAAAATATAESYQLQPFAQLHYQYRTQLADDTSYNPYASPHYHNHNLYNTRFAFINGIGGAGSGAGGGTPSTVTAPTGTTADVAGGGVAVDAPRSSRTSGARSPAKQKKAAAAAAAAAAATTTAQHMVAESSEHKAVTALPPSATISTYIYDADETISSAVAAAQSAQTAHAYVAPSEAAYFATATSVRDGESPANRVDASAGVSKRYEKSDVRRD